MVIQGVIRPPPEIRAVANRTALYVAKNGRAFETRILNSDKGKSPKFAFLHATSPFHAYYEERIQFYENGGEDDDGDGKGAEGKTKDKKSGSSAADDKKKKSTEEKRKTEESKDEAKIKKTNTQRASAVDPVAKALLTQRAKIAEYRSSQEKATADEQQQSEAADNNRKPPSIVPPPAPFHFVNIVAPSALTIAQIETIKLVAQFTALDGRGGHFLSQLTVREWTNPAFGFCQPRHGHFAYFSALVDAYRRVLSLWTGATDDDDDGVKEMADNVPHCLNLAAYRAEYERYKEEQAQKDGEPAGGAPGGVAVIDWHDFVVVETIDFAPDEVVELSMLPPPPPPPPTPSKTATKNTPPTAAAAAVGRDEGDMEESDDDEEEEQIRVVPSYTPKVVSTQRANEEVMAIDPITGKSVPVKDMPEHMRIQLLDPKWAEERKKFQEKQKDSNLVSGDMVASNLARFAQARGGMFGTTAEEADASDSKKRLEEANRVIREQAQQPSTVGPSLPPPPGAALPPSLGQQQLAPPLPPHQRPPLDPSLQATAAKRPRLELPAAVAAPPYAMPSSSASQPQLPPGGTTTASQPPLPPPPPGFQQADAAKPPPPAAVVDEPFGGMAAVASQPAKETLSEAEFAASLSKPEVTLQIRVPNDPAQMAWNFYGQIVSLSSVDVMSTVKSVKQDLSKTHLNGMPVNKIQLKSTATGMFLKDAMTLAALNIGPTATLELKPKGRGGRK